MKTICLMMVQLLFCLGLSYAQTSNQTLNVIQVGRPMPDFTLADVQFFSSNKASLTDFKGKWLILDFWNIRCGGCIESFPRMSKLKSELGDQVNLLMIGTFNKRDTRDITHNFFKKIRKEEGVALSAAYDTVLVQKFGVIGMPDIIIIDPNGIVRARTGKVDVNDMKIFLSGGTPKLRKSFVLQDQQKIKYDYKTPFLINGNGGNELSYLYRSVIAKTPENLPNYFGQGNGKLEMLGFFLPEMYRTAYFGNFGSWDFLDKDLYGNVNYNLILEVSDSTLFVGDSKWDNSYSYSVNYPPIDLSKKKYGYRIEHNSWLRGKMQHDLADYLPYDVAVENRMSPCYKLIIANQSKVSKMKSKGGDILWNRPFSNSVGIFTNYPWDGVVLSISNKFRLEAPLIDETGLTGNFDINLDVLNREALIKRLKENGFDIVFGEKEMKCLVIRDRKAENETVIKN